MRPTSLFACAVLAMAACQPPGAAPSSDTFAPQDASATDDPGLGTPPAIPGKTGATGKSGPSTGPTGPTNTTGPTGPTAPTSTPPFQDGSWDHPFIIDTFPATLTGNTATGGFSVADVYTPCAAVTSEKGPELVYTFEAPDNGTLSVSVDDVSGDQIDIDVHLLDSKSKDACIARNNVGFVNTLEGGKIYYIVADTWWNGSKALAGPFTLTVTFVATAVSNGTCPSDMVLVNAPSGDVCMDKYEAPNKLGEYPFVQYDFNESEAWCQARGKRLCYDDEWTFACAGPQGYKYVYGNTLDHTKCNTGKSYKTHNETLIGNWPHSANKATHENKPDHFANAAMTAPASVDHVESIYQAEPSGSRAGCVGAAGVYDLTGSIEEWTRRRSGGTTNFHGNLKGRYWAEARTCQGNITVHGDPFMFYEIGFRCCQAP